MAGPDRIAEIEIPASTLENYQRMREAIFTAESRYAPFLSNPSTMDSSIAASIAAAADARRLFQSGETIDQIRSILPC